MSLAEIRSYPHIQAIAHTGSREICNPPPMDTDDDWLVLIAPEHKDHFMDWYVLGLGVPNGILEGWEIGGSAPPGEVSEFTSLKKGEFNIIMTTDPTYFKYFEAATTVAKKLNLLDKEDRKMLFAAVMSGKKYDPEVAQDVPPVETLTANGWVVGGQGTLNWHALNNLVPEVPL